MQPEDQFSRTKLFDGISRFILLQLTRKSGDGDHTFSSPLPGIDLAGIACTTSYSSDRGIYGACFKVDPFLTCLRRMVQIDMIDPGPLRECEVVGLPLGPNVLSSYSLVALA